MKKIKFLAIYFMAAMISLFACLNSYAQTESLGVGKARKRAASFLGTAEKAISRVNLLNQTDASSVCVFNDSTNGSFVIVSTNENMPEVLGYSDCGLFDANNIPPQLKDLLEEYEVISDHTSTLTTTATNCKVNALKASQFKVASKTLTTATYNQEEPYNNYCPSDCYTGCTATAMSIVMKYYEWPQSGRNSHSYEWNNQALSYDYNTTFDWSNMLNSYEKGKYNTAQANAVAQLCYACGVSINTNYSTTGSSASLSDASFSLVKYFKYSPEITLLHQSSLGYTADEWMSLIKTEINAGRPIIYSGRDSMGENGHAFVIQGYKDNYVSVNWGWGGHYNGYFLLSSMIPYESRDYSYDHWMIVNITPDYNETEFSPLQTRRVVSSQSMESNVEVVKKWNTFTVATGNVQNIDENIYEDSIAVALINKEGIREIVGKKKISLESGFYYETLNFNCKSNVNSEYGDSLALMWKDKDRWIRVPGDGVVKSAIAVKKAIVTEADLSPLQIGNDINTDAEQVRESTKFTVTAYALENRSNTIFEDSIAIALINKEGIREIVGKKKISLESGYHYNYISFSCKSDVNSEDGDSLALMWKNKNSWMRIPGYGTARSAIAVNGVNETSSIGNVYKEATETSDLYVYQSNGMLVMRVPRQKDESGYSKILSRLRHGIYIIKDGKMIRKFIK